MSESEPKNTETEPKKEELVIRWERCAIFTCNDCNEEWILRNCDHWDSGECSFYASGLYDGHICVDKEVNTGQPE